MTDPVDDDLFLTREDKDNPSIVFKEKYKKMNNITIYKYKQIKQLINSFEELIIMIIG